MWLDHQGKRIIPRIPKCASTTFSENYMGPTGRGLTLEGNDHNMLREVSAGTREKIKDWEVLLVVRDPIKWATSLYTMCNNAKSHWREYVHKGCPLGASPANFVRNLRFTPYDWALYKNKSGELKLPPNLKVIRVEDYDEFFGKPCEERNKTDGLKPFHLSDELLGEIEKKFHRELEHYR